MGHKLSEAEFQAAIVAALTTADTDTLKYEAFGRYEIVYDPNASVPDGHIHYHRASALLPQAFADFVMATQPDAWQKLEGQHGAETGRTLALNLKSALDERGCLDVLRRGLTLDAVDIDVVHFPPTDDNPDDTSWRDNHFVVVEELEYDPNQPKDHKGRLDLTLFLNGIPVVTVELKNLGTQQTVGNAIEQYEKTRSAAAPLFRFPYRALVHFVVDQRRAFMTTRVNGARTRWFPFDEHLFDDAGGKPTPRTGFLWKALWRPRSLLQLVQHFVVLESPDPPAAGVAAKHPLQDAALIFPRVHQRRAVLTVLEGMHAHGPGQRYLVQHSTGSGKSFSIGWLAVIAESLHRDGAKVFDKVLVVSDRRIIHRQLRDLLRNLSPAHVNTDDMVSSVDGGASTLVKALDDSPPIIISTVHAFFHARDKVAQQAGKRFCVIIDEAHRSQGGDLNKSMRSVLDGTVAPEQRSLLKELGELKAKNLSMVAFTATPTDRTLQDFGRKVSDTEWRPHDTYTMRQARREGFIVNVLRNYVLWKQTATATIKGRAEQLIKQGGVSLRDILAEDAEMVSLKAGQVAEHFLGTVKDQLGGQARAMLVTVSKTAALRYRRALLDALKARDAGDVGVLIAFTGSHTDTDGEVQESVTEGSLNGKDAEGRPIQDERIADALRHTHRILIAVDKFQTGFDEPKLLAMYVDKSLRGINAVQTLSRLNRPFPGKGRRLRSTDPPPVHPFVVDFYDNTAEVLAAFAKYDKEAVPETVIPGDLLIGVADDIRSANLYSQETLDRAWDLWGRRSALTSTERNEFDALIIGVIDRFYGLPEDLDRIVCRYKIRRFLFFWSSAHEVVTRDVETGERLELEKQALLFAKVLKPFDDWNPGGDPQPAQRLRADHVSFEGQDLAFVAKHALLPSKDDDFADPREITVGTPKQRRLKTLEELVAAFNAQNAPAEGDDSPPLDVVERLEAAVVAAAAEVDSEGVVSLGEYRRRLEPALRKSIRSVAKDGASRRELVKFTFADRDRFEALTDHLAEAEFEQLKKGA